MSDELPRVLLVDDEPLLLEGICRQLRWHFEVRTATSGASALALIEREEPFSVIVSDMRMPQMDGAELLGRVRELAPDMVRVLLTGQSDLAQAIRAVNEGQIFRFLSKPCSGEHLIATLQDGVAQHRLLTAERELLGRTLAGSVRMLVDALALANPTVFGSARRLEKYVAQVLDALGVVERWPVELGALMCLVPLVTLPPETLTRYASSTPLALEEQRMVRRLPEVAEQLLSSIPRIEPVRELLRSLDAAPCELKDPLGILVAA
jgi:response regulator RpfG family c-di-GMP phosphodiesterase